MLVAATLAAVLVGLLTLHVAAGASSGVDRCDRFAADSLSRADQVTGSGGRVVVIGDSWAAGLGLDRPADSWPSRLAGTVHVAGFSGSGFSAHASACGPVGYADRAPAATHDGAGLVVVEGGLNDVDQTDSAIRAGFAALMSELHGRRVVVVGPATAPSRAAAVPRVDDLLASLSRERGVPYVRTSALHLPYLPDRLHLTPAGHQRYGDFVADRIERLGLS